MKIKFLKRGRVFSMKNVNKGLMIGVFVLSVVGMGSWGTVSASHAPVTETDPVAVAKEKVERAIVVLKEKIGAMKQSVAGAQRSAGELAAREKNAAIEDAKKVAEQKALGEKTTAVEAAKTAAALVIDSLVTKVSDLDSAVSAILPPPAVVTTPGHDTAVPPVSQPQGTGHSEVVVRH